MAPGPAATAPSPVFGHLQQPSMVDYPGHLAAVLFTAGCNFRCGFCHNPQLMGPSRPGMSWAQLRCACDKLAANWVSAAVITGGEPTLATELPELIGYLKTLGWHIKLDTNGSNPQVLTRCLSLVDYVAMDIKVGLDGYPALTGFDDPAALRTSMEVIRRDAPDYEFRTTLIESLHTQAQLSTVARLVRGARRYVLQPFVPSAKLPDAHYRSCARTSPQFMEAAAEHFSGQVDELVVRGA